mgnify:CR=1 FL=1
MNSYFSLHGSEVEQSYIRGLFDQFESAKMMGAYHLALFAYHLLFVCFLYQTLYKIKLWFPGDHRMAFVSFSAARRKKFREAGNPTEYADSQNKEKSLFEFLNIFCNCEELVGKCKSLVDFRNNNLGHANYALVDEFGFEKKIAEYDQTAEKIHGITQKRLAAVFDEYATKIETTGEEITKDTLELDLIIPNSLSDADLGDLAAECGLKGGREPYRRIGTVLRDDFGVEVNFAGK